MYTLLPSFIGLTAAQAEAKASSYGLSVVFLGGDGVVIEQNYPEKKRVDKIGGPLYLTLAETEKPKPEDNNTSDKTDDNKTEDNKTEDNSSSNSSGNNNNSGTDNSSNNQDAS